MWDWEIIEYLRGEGIPTLAPYDAEQTHRILTALRVKRELRESKFLVFQDNPGEGAQAPIFKRFYWWEDECTRRMADKFGVTIEKRSFRELGAAAKQIPDDVAEAEWKRWAWTEQTVKGRPLTSAVKLYLAVKRHLDADQRVRGVGINCLNESHFSDTTPCLAWAKLFEDQRMLWGCEADTLSMLTKYILHHSLNCPILMTNLYPFVLGQAALKHERIADFPSVASEPENHILIAHCGFMGVIPRPFATRWSLRKKVLAIVDDNATAIDADLPTGEMTLAKLHPTMDKMTVAEGELTGYSQFPGSDCLNGGVLKVRDGHQLMRSISSHHYLLTLGHNLNDIQLLGDVFDFEVRPI
jgi:L-fucose isomerase-like protein